MPAQKSKSRNFDFKVQKNNSHIDIEDLEKWIAAEVSGPWIKRALKHSVVYTFTNPDDALKFKFRWTFA